MAERYTSQYTGREIDAGIAQTTTNKNDISTINITINNPTTGILARLNNLDNDETGKILQVTTNQTKIQEIETNIGEINEIIASHTTSITESASTITDLQNNKVDKVSLNNYYDYEETDQAIKDALEGYATADSLTGINQQIAQLEQTDDGFQSQLNDYDSTIQDIQQDIAILEALIGNNDTEEGDITSLSEQLTNINNNITTLQTDKADKTTVEESLALKLDIDDFDNWQSDTYTTDLNTKVNTTDFNDYQTQIQTEMEDMDTRNRVDILEIYTGINTEITDTELDQLGITPFPNQIESLQEQINTLSGSDMASLTSKIEELEKTIQDLTERLERLEGTEET